VFRGVKVLFSKNNIPSRDSLKINTRRPTDSFSRGGGERDFFSHACMHAIY